VRMAESVADELRRRILDGGTDVDGYRLPTQDQLVEEFGVSFPSVREAIRILETEGLVTVQRGSVGGLVTHRPDAGSAAYHLGLVLQGERVTLRDLADGLQLLEPLCAAECARREDRLQAVVPALRSSIEASVALVDSGAEFTHASREFHELVVAHAPNATVRSVVRTLVALWTAHEEAWAQATWQRGEYPSASEAREVVRTHRRLVSDIEAGRAERAERLARSHLAASQAVVLADHRHDLIDAGLARTMAAGRTGRL
jgi:GntR family transcriptional regulator, transcriptional repressor for pyruvate dehydrogenase complex